MIVFRLNLATSPELEGRKLGVELATPYFQGSAPLPPAGMTSIEHFELPADVTFDLEMHFQVDGNSIGATVHRLCDGDVFSVFAVARGPSAAEGRGVLYLCNVRHAGAKVEHCKVRCADGTEGDCCVTCRDESGDSETKICC
jgi:hypothetical protein